MMVMDSNETTNVWSVVLFFTKFEETVENETERRLLGFWIVQTLQTASDIGLQTKSGTIDSCRYLDIQV